MVALPDGRILISGIQILATDKKHLFKLFGINFK